MFVMLSQDYCRQFFEPNMHTKDNHRSNQLIVVTLYVEDIPIVWSLNNIWNHQAKLEIFDACSIKDLGPLSYSSK